MVFSNEEKQIWEGSEVMKEFERIAREHDDMFETPAEAYLPVKETDEDEVNWEDESDEKKLIDAVIEFEDKDESLEENKDESELGIDESLELEDMESYKLSLNLHNGLMKLAHYLGKTGRSKEAYRVECALRDIRLTLKGDKQW